MRAVSTVSILTLLAASAPGVVRAQPADEVPQAEAAPPAVAPEPDLGVSESASPASPSTLDILAMPTGKPFGSLMYATGVVEVAYVAGTLPGARGFATAFRYSERGGILAGVIAAAGSAAAAQHTANVTGQTQYYDANPDNYGHLGMTFDLYTEGLGGSVGGLNFELFHIIPMNDDDPLPWVLEIGSTIFAWAGEPEGEGGSDSGGAGIGIFVGSTIPVTEWAQLEPKLKLGFGDINFMGELGVTGNIGNRFFARALLMAGTDTSFAMDMGLTGTVGVRL